MLNEHPIARRTAHQRIGGALTLEGESLAVLLLDEILETLHRRSTRTRHRGHLTGTALKSMNRHGLLVRIRMHRVLREATHSRCRSKLLSRHLMGREGADRNGLELLLAVVVDRVVEDAVVQLESSGANEAGTVDEDILRISFLTNVAETTLFVPVLDNSDFGHDVE